MQIYKFQLFHKKQQTILNLDYLQLYKKYTFSERSSYRLDNIGEFEVGEKKIEYEGTLNDL